MLYCVFDRFVLLHKSPIFTVFVHSLHAFLVDSSFDLSVRYFFNSTTAKTDYLARENEWEIVTNRSKTQYNIGVGK